MIRFLRRLLGIDALQKRMQRLESERARLEVRVITAEEANASRAELSRGAPGLQQYQEPSPLPADLFASPETPIVDDIPGIVERYGFQRFIPPLEQAYPSPVISLQEFQEHPELYFHKLGKGFMGFPVGLNVQGINKLLRERYGVISIHGSPLYSNNDAMYFSLESILQITGSSFNDEPREKAAMQLMQAVKRSDLDRSSRVLADLLKWDVTVNIDALDFLANYRGLVQYVLDLPEVKRKEKNHAVQAFQTVRLVYLTALEIAGSTQIKPTADLLRCADEPLEERVTTLSINDSASGIGQLKHQIRESLLHEPRGTSYQEIQELLPIRSKTHFRRLASERTAEILANDRQWSGLTEQLRKDIRDYSVGESMVLACYFARNIIDHYATLDDAVKAVLSGHRDERISGKCTDYTGLALHYLREYLVPLHPDKFKNWAFGYDTNRIGDYKHCYIKAIHQLPDGMVDVYFIDPTLLASQGIKGLKTPQKVIELMDTANHPLQIKRDAEDLLYRKKG